MEAGRDREAAALFRSAARRGEREAMLNLGYLYDTGRGVARSFPLARRWYKFAIGKGSPEAAHNLATCYRDLGMRRWAAYWFRRARELERHG